jgi:multisubunit Na+/H+ antiporter MnhG subunit
MFFGILTLLTALSMATVAAVFAIYGIIAIFAGMPQFALIMGAVIELGKIVGISWLYRNWNEPTKIKYFMAPIVLVAMLLTSMGIFGLLSKAHLEQTSPVANNEIQIERLDQQIAREQSRILDAEQVISQLDQSVQALIEFDRIRGPDGAIAVRESQADQREVLRQTIDTAQTELDGLEDQKLELSQQLRAIELEVGPIKYIAELIYNDGQDRTEEAVRWVIIAFIFVFDPMAILLLMAANYTLDQQKKNPVDIALAPIIVENKNEDMADQVIPEPVDNITVRRESEPIEREEPNRPANLPETIIEPNERDMASLQQEGAIDIIPGVIDVITSVQDQPASITEVEKANILEQLAMDQESLGTEFEAALTANLDELYEDDTLFEPKLRLLQVENKEIATEGITLACDVGGGYIEYNKHLFQKDALKEIKPELFSLRTDGPTMPSSSFGTQFPKIAKKKDIFVRVDVIPNRVYRFEGIKWIEINKELSSTYLYDQEYIKYLVDKIDKGEYDVDLLSDQEKIQIEEFLNSQNS